LFTSKFPEEASFSRPARGCKKAEGVFEEKEIEGVLNYS
jgi:hypothetical protein